MADAGAVSWMFHKKGDIVIPKSAATVDDLMNIVFDAGGEDRATMAKTGKSSASLRLRSDARSGEEGRHRARLRPA